MALYYPRPNTTGWTVKNIPVTGGALNLSSGVDYILVAPTSGGQLVPITGYVDINGGRNISWIGGIIGGRTSVPNLTTNYDKTNKGIRIMDGDDVRSIYLEGIWYKPGTYLSDALQIAVRNNNGLSLTVQNFRVDAYTYGNKGTPGFHSDQIQCYGGPLNFKLNGWTGKKVTYQGFYLDPGDGRSLPTGSGKVNWEFRNVNLEGDSSLGGAKYLYANREPVWTGATVNEFYINGSVYNNKDSFGNAPSNMVIGTHADFVPASLWTGNIYDEAGAGGGGTPGTGTYNISASDSISISQTSSVGIGGTLAYKSASDSINISVTDNSGLNNGSTASSGSVSVNTQLWPSSASGGTPPAPRDHQTFGYPDVLATYVGKGRYYVESSCTIVSIRASVNTAPTGASILVDVNKNGTTVFTTQSNRPTIAASGFTSGAVTSMDVTSLSAGDYITVDIDQIGSSVAGSDLTVTVVME